MLGFSGVCRLCRKLDANLRGTHASRDLLYRSERIPRRRPAPMPCAGKGISLVCRRRWIKRTPVDACTPPPLPPTPRRALVKRSIRRSRRERESGLSGVGGPQARRRGADGARAHGCSQTHSVPAVVGAAVSCCGRPPWCSHPRSAVRQIVQHAKTQTRRGTYIHKPAGTASGAAELASRRPRRRERSV